MRKSNPLEILYALRIANWDLAFATAFGALVAGNFLAEFIRTLTTDDRMRGWISALPAVLGALQILGSVYAQRFGSYKKFCAIGGFFWRFWWIPIAILPLLPASFPKIHILIACIAAQAIAIHLIQPTYNAWLGSLVPSSHRGWYFARRIAIATVVGGVIGFPASFLIDHFRANQMLDQGLTLIFSAGILFGFISFYFYMRMPDTHREEVNKRSLLDSIREMARPLNDKIFRKLLLFLIVFTFSQFIAAPFFFYYAREVVDLKLVDLQIFAAIHGIASLASAPLWGYLSDKYGNKPVLFLSGILLSIGPLMWIFAKPGDPVLNYLVLGFGHIAAGIAWTGVGVGQFNFILAVVKQDIREPALGFVQASSAVIMGVAPLIGGFLLYFTRGFVEETQSYHILFITNAFLRLGAIFLLIGIIDPTSSRIRAFLKQIAGVRPGGVLAMQQLKKAPDVETREEAIRKIGEAGMKMAESSLVKLLNDTSPRVRREAAIALQKVGGEETVQSIVNLILTQPHLVEEEMIETLASIRSDLAIQPLISLLENPSSALRRASAKALGKLKSKGALGPLMNAATSQGDPELRRSAIQALRLIGDPSCQVVIENALSDEFPSVRIAAAEACQELKLKELAPKLREILKTHLDDTSPEFAYALASVGTKEDLKLILSTAMKLESDIGRKRCLMAAALLLNVEEEFYRLLTGDTIERDKLLLELSSGKSVQARAFKRAVFHTQSSKYTEAIQVLAKAYDFNDFDLVAQFPSEETFLLTVATISKNRRS